MTLPVHPRIKKRLTTKSTVWVKTGHTGFGQGIFATPVTVPARWEKRYRRAISLGGVEVVLTSKIWIDRELAIGDFIVEGIATSTSPTTNSQEIVDLKYIPSVDGKYMEYIIYL